MCTTQSSYHPSCTSYFCGDMLKFIKPILNLTEVYVIFQNAIVKTILQKRNSIMKSDLLSLHIISSLPIATRLS